MRTDAVHRPPIKAGCGRYLPGAADAVYPWTTSQNGLAEKESGRLELTPSTGPTPYWPLGILLTKQGWMKKYGCLLQRDIDTSYILPSGKEAAMGIYAIIRVEKCKLGDIGRIYKHHERKKEEYIHRTNNYLFL